MCENFEWLKLKNKRMRKKWYMIEQKQGKGKREEQGADEQMKGRKKKNEREWKSKDNEKSDVKKEGRR